MKRRRKSRRRPTTHAAFMEAVHSVLPSGASRHTTVVGNKVLGDFLDSQLVDGACAPPATLRCIWASTDPTPLEVTDSDYLDAVDRLVQDEC